MKTLLRGSEGNNLEINNEIKHTRLALWKHHVYLYLQSF